MHRHGQVLIAWFAVSLLLFDSFKAVSTSQHSNNINDNKIRNNDSNHFLESSANFDVDVEKDLGLFRHDGGRSNPSHSNDVKRNGKSKNELSFSTKETIVNEEKPEVNKVAKEAEKPSIDKENKSSNKKAGFKNDKHTKGKHLAAVKAKKPAFVNYGQIIHKQHGRQPQFHHKNDFVYEAEIPATIDLAFQPALATLKPSGSSRNKPTDLESFTRASKVTKPTRPHTHVLSRPTHRLNQYALQKGNI